MGGRFSGRDRGIGCGKKGGYIGEGNRREAVERGIRER